MSSFWKVQPLEKAIQYEIDYHKVDAKKVKPDTRLSIQEANDQFFVRNVTQALNYFWTLIYLSIGLLLLLFLVSLRMKKGEIPLEAYLSVTPFLVFALFYLMIFFLAPVKEVILDRLGGEISYPRLYGNKEHRTLKFDSLYVYETMTSTGDFAATGKKIYIKDRKYSYQWDLKSVKCDEYWSFMVWYMDKNRPLPPGTAFDKYRQRDFERRKAEGFPEPLYPSNFNTPEATTKQQRERKKIGGW